MEDREKLILRSYIDELLKPCSSVVSGIRVISIDNALKLAEECFDVGRNYTGNIYEQLDWDILKK